MNLNLHLLRMFVEVISRGSFSRAAEELHVSQPAVSKGVREFEAQVGMSLIQRGTGGVHPTEAGHVLLQHARTLFAAERAAINELTSIRELRNGTLRIGASTTAAAYFLPAVMRDFHKAHPGINLCLTRTRTPSLAELLTEGEIDIALAEGAFDKPGICVKPWREDAFVLCAASSHKLARTKAAVSPAILAGELFIMREPQSGTRVFVEKSLSAAKIAPGRVLEVGSNEAITKMVSEGIGIAVLSLAVAADHIAADRITIVNVHGFPVRQTITRLSLPDQRLSPAAIAFNRLLDLCAEVDTSINDVDPAIAIPSIAD